MASYQRISEDVIRQVITVEEKEALQKYHKMQKGILEMRDSVKELEKERDKYERGSQKWKEITKDISDQKNQIKAEESELRKLRDTLSVNCMTMTQLKKLARDLTREMDNMSAAANPEEYAALSQRLADVKNRMKDLTIQTQYLKDSQEGVQVKSFLEGTAIAKIAEWSIGGIKDLISGIHDLADEGVEMARAADGITKAFNELNNPGLLDNLREATKGTVNDVELMKAAVQANDFRIPLGNLGKLLSFAQLKAQQTGQSVEYMTQSIVTGLGRKSVMILDNLGLSAAEINEELSKTGDFAQAVATIIDKQLAKAGETYVSAADRAAQRTVALQNAQKELGDALLPLKEEYEDAYGSIQMGIIDISLVIKVISH